MKAGLTNKKLTVTHCYVLLLVMVALKMLLVANEEILAFYLPHDDLWQILASKRLYWGGEYDVTKLLHLPIYPIFIQLVRMSGLPLRIAIDLLYCLSSLLLLGALERAKIPLKVCLLVGVAVLFHPGSFQLPNRCGAETLLAPLMIGAVAISILSFYMREKRNLWLIVCSCVLWSLAWNTRKESIAILLIFLAGAFFVYLSDYKLGVKKALKRIFLIFGIPIISCFLLAATVKTINMVRWGSFTSSVITSPGFVDAFKELQRIKPEQHIDYTPITSDMRKTAYLFSPSFKKLEPHFEGEIGKAWAWHANQFYDLKGVITQDLEISGGWVYWCLFDCVVAAGYGGAPGETGKFCEKIASELKKARQSNKYKSRNVYLAFIDPNITSWLGRLPKSVKNIYSVFLSPSVYSRKLLPFPVADNLISGQFDEQANRRSHLVHKNSVILIGWAKATHGEVAQITIKNKDNKYICGDALYVRKDVDPEKKSGFAITSCSFKSQEDWLNSSFSLHFSDGKIFTAEIDELELGRMTTDFNEGQLTICLDRNNFEEKNFMTWRIQAWLQEYYLLITTFLSYCLIPCFILFLLVAFLKRSIPHEAFIFIILASAVIARILLFALLDATSWIGQQPRYIYPVMGLYSVFLVLMFWKGVASICEIYQLLKKKRAC